MIAVAALLVAAVLPVPQEVGLQVEASVPRAGELELRWQLDPGWRRAPDSWPLVQLDAPAGLRLAGEVDDSPAAFLRNGYLSPPHELLLREACEVVRFEGEDEAPLTFNVVLYALPPESEHPVLLRRRLQVVARVGAHAEPVPPVPAPWGARRRAGPGDLLPGRALPRVFGPELDLLETLDADHPLLLLFVYPSCL